MNVSVIIPTYNRATLLERALRSVFAQISFPQEVIVVDDGSTDATYKTVCATFPQARYVWQRNQGVSSARNRGLQDAQGEWLAFLDSDDEWLPEKLEVQTQVLQTNPAYRICHSDEIWIRRGKRVNPTRRHAKHGGLIFQRCLPLCVISPSSVIIHRSVFDKVGLFNESLPACEDYDLWLRVCAVYPVLYVARPLVVKYGGHEDQLSRRYPAMDRFRIKALEGIIRSGTLSAPDQRAALSRLLEKIEIYRHGAVKRQKWKEVTECQQKQAYYSQLSYAVRGRRLMNEKPRVPG